MNLKTLTGSAFLLVFSALSWNARCATAETFEGSSENAVRAEETQTQRQEIGLDIHLGLALSKFNTEQKLNGSQSFKEGVSAGVGYDFNLNSNFALHPELNYIQKGTDLSYDTGSSRTALRVEMGLNYLELPLLLKFSPAQGSLKPFLMAGPSVSLLLAKSLTASVTDASGRTREINTVKASDIPIRNLDYGFVIAAGLDMDITHGMSILVDVRYSEGLLNFDKSDDKSTRNRVIASSVGVRF